MKNALNVGRQVSETSSEIQINNGEKSATMLFHLNEEKFSRVKDKTAQKKTENVKERVKIQRKSLTPLKHDKEYRLFNQNERKKRAN